MSFVPYLLSLLHLSVRFYRFPFISSFPSFFHLSLSLLLCLQYSIFLPLSRPLLFSFFVFICLFVALIPPSFLAYPSEAHDHPLTAVWSGSRTLSTQTGEVTVQFTVTHERSPSAGCHLAQTPLPQAAAVL